MNNPATDATDNNSKFVEYEIVTNTVIFPHDSEEWPTEITYQTDRAHTFHEGDDPLASCEALMKCDFYAHNGVYGYGRAKIAIANAVACKIR